MDELELLGQEFLKEVGQDSKVFAKAELNKLAELLPKALELAAKKSATPVDDVVVAAIKEPLKAIVKDLINKI